MSETDDTDVLLLIPPGFFLVNSSESENSLLESSRTVVHKSQSCTAQVLGKLVDQVHTLENRLENLELSTSETLSSRGTRSRHKTWDFNDSCESSNTKYYTFPRRRRRKYPIRHKNQDLSLTSLDSLSTYEKKVPPLKIGSAEPVKQSHDYFSMDGDISSIVSTPSKKNDKLLLNEIDEFLTKVETYESPEGKLHVAESELSPESVRNGTNNYILHKLDNKHDDVKLPSGRVVSSSLLDRYIYLVRSNPDTGSRNEKPTTDTSYSTLHNESTVKNDAAKQSQDSYKNEKSPTLRRLNFDENRDVQATSTPKKENHTRSSYFSSLKPTSNKVYERATKVLEQYKSQYKRNNHPTSSSTNYISSPKREEFKVPRQYNLEIKGGPKLSMSQNRFLDSIDTDLLSLSDMWGEKKEVIDKAESVKLEEERMKREHCEQMIQELQKKLLEQQERLAVAMKVDRSKDAAINKLKEAWLRLTNSLERAEERHKAALDRMTSEVENFKTVANDAQKKTNHFESELYKALDLAHDYQEKYKQLLNEGKESQLNTEKALKAKDEVIVGKQKEIDMLKENCETVMMLNKQSTDCMKNIEDALTKEKQDHEATKEKLTEACNAMHSIEEENCVLKQERDILKQKVNEERSRGNILECQLAEKQNQTSDLLKKCDALDEMATSLRRQLEVQRGELKLHYQKQLEDAVLAKLHEFQMQLDKAERDAERDARAKEAAVADALARQLARLEEQHKLEINVLEEKHKEEIKLYRLQLAQSGEKISLLEGKVDSFRRRRTQLASQLHGVMQAQWKQALTILTGTAITDSRDTVPSPSAHDYAPPKVPPLAMPSFADGNSGGPSRDFALQGLSDHELQHYVRMLLTKPPSIHDGSGDALSQTIDNKDSMEEPTSDRPEKTDKRDKSKRHINFSKPPWKA